MRRIFYDYGDRATRVVEMKESEKGLLAAAVFIGIFFWSKVKAPNPSGGISSRTPQIPSGPAIATRFSENSKGVVV